MSKVMPSSTHTIVEIILKLLSNHVNRIFTADLERLLNEISPRLQQSSLTKETFLYSAIEVKKTLFSEENNFNKRKKEFHKLLSFFVKIDIINWNKNTNSQQLHNHENNGYF